ncbi:MAG: YDG domain-containing protein [Bacteroidales bacterium]|jgi:hypothetical protein|nr:YDG domain-containing protein [Bacteroidales bacterium]
MTGIRKIAAAILLTAACSIPAFADGTINIGTGVGDGDGWSFASSTVTITDNGNYTINGSTTTNRIRVNPGITANITLSDVSINVSATPGTCAFDMDGATVTLMLTGSNVLRSGSSHAGLQVLNSAILTIAGTGSLAANGGSNAAGIGGNTSSGSQNTGITINGGTVIATGGSAGAGIGGGMGNMNYNTMCGTITINSGTVTANGGSYGAAGIGNGAQCGYAAGIITINGGTVTATGGSNMSGGPGIGGGHMGSVSQVIINGGTITANAAGSAAAIGGNSNNSGTLIINGGSLRRSNTKGPAPENGQNTAVFLNTLIIGNTPVTGGTPVTAGSINGTNCSETPSAGVYGIRDVKTDAEGKVYFYLPSATGNEFIALTANSKIYGRNYTRNASHSNVQTLGLPYDITLSKTGTYNFPAASYGYSAQASLTVTVNNAGYNPTDALSVALKGTNFDKFTLSTASISSIAMDGTDSFTVMPNTGLAAGTCTATITVSGGNNIIASFNVSFTVNPKNITVTGITATKIYNGNAGFTEPHIDITNAVLEGNLDGTSLTLDKSSATGSFATADVQSGNIVFSDFALGGTAAVNYMLTQPTVSASITPKNITVSDATIDPKTYDGTTDATVTDIIFIGLENGESLGLDTDYDITAAAFDDPNVGNGNRTVQMTVALKNTVRANNYTLTSGTDWQLANQSIGKATLTASHLDYALTGITYDGLPHGVVMPALQTSPTLYTGLGTVTVKYESADGTTYPLNAAHPVNADSYTVKITVDEGDNFNAVTDLELTGGTFDIGKAILTLAHLDYALTGTIYDGLPHGIATPSLQTSPTLYTGLGTVTVQYESADGTTYPLSAIQPVNADSYTVKITVADGDNFIATATDLELTGSTFDIGKATLTAAHLDYDLTGIIYDGLPHGIVTPSLQTSPTLYTGLGTVTVKYESADGTTYPLNAAHPVNADSYTVKITVADGDNFNAATDLELTGGTFDIGKATHAITFEPAATLLVENGAYPLLATVATSGAPELPILFLTSDAALAELSGNTLLPKQSGTVTITAYIAPDPNYEAAAEVSRPIILTSSSTSTISIDVLGTTLSDNGSRYIVDDPAAETVTVVVTPQDNGAKVIYNGQEAPTFTVDVSRGGTQTITFTVVSQDGTQEETYTLLIEQLLAFEEYTNVKWNIIFVLHLRKLTEETYNPSQCRWYRGDEPVGTGFFYSRGESREEHFIAGEIWHFELETPSGIVRSTEYTIPETTAPSKSISVHPNPVAASHPFYLSLGNYTPGADASDYWIEETMRELDVAGNNGDGIIRIYNSIGILVLQTQAKDDLTELRLAKSGIYIIRVNGQTAKVVVK